MAKCLDRLRAKRRLATLTRRKQIIAERKMSAVISPNDKDVQEYVSGNFGIEGKMVADAVIQYTKKFGRQPSEKEIRFIMSSIEKHLDSAVPEERTPTFSELRADENRASSRTKARRKLYSVDKFKFSETVGNRLPNMGTRIPRKLKKQIKTITRKQYESVLAA